MEIDVDEPDTYKQDDSRGGGAQEGYSYRKLLETVHGVAKISRSIDDYDSVRRILILSMMTDALSRKTKQDSTFVGLRYDRHTAFLPGDKDRTGICIKMNRMDDATNSPRGCLIGINEDPDSPDVWDKCSSILSAVMSSSYVLSVLAPAQSICMFVAEGDLPTVPESGASSPSSSGYRFLKDSNYFLVKYSRRMVLFDRIEYESRKMKRITKSVIFAALGVFGASSNTINFNIVYRTEIQKGKHVDDRDAFNIMRAVVNRFNDVNLKLYNGALDGIKPTFLFEDMEGWEPIANMMENEADKTKKISIFKDSGLKGVFHMTSSALAQLLVVTRWVLAEKESVEKAALINNNIEIDPKTSMHIINGFGRVGFSMFSSAAGSDVTGGLYIPPIPSNYTTFGDVETIAKKAVKVTSIVKDSVLSADGGGEPTQTPTLDELPAF